MKNVRNERENRKRIDYDYQIGQQVLKKIPDPSKLQTRFHGPIEIVQVHVNGNLTMQIAPHVRKRKNIRQVKPFNQ